MTNELKTTFAEHQQAILDYVLTGEMRDSIESLNLTLGETFKDLAFYAEFNRNDQNFLIAQRLINIVQALTTKYGIGIPLMEGSPLLSRNQVAAGNMDLILKVVEIAKALNVDNLMESLAEITRMIFANNLQETIQTGAKLGVVAKEDFTEYPDTYQDMDWESLESAYTKFRAVMYTKFDTYQITPNQLFISQIKKYTEAEKDYLGEPEQRQLYDMDDSEIQSVADFADQQGHWVETLSLLLEADPAGSKWKYGAQLIYYLCKGRKEEYERKILTGQFIRPVLWGHVSDRGFQLREGREWFQKGPSGLLSYEGTMPSWLAKSVNAADAHFDSIAVEDRNQKLLHLVFDGLADDIPQDDLVTKIHATAFIERFYRHMHNRDEIIGGFGEGAINMRSAGTYERFALVMHTLLMQLDPMFNMINDAFGETTN